MFEGSQITVVKKENGFLVKTQDSREYVAFDINHLVTTMQTALAIEPPLHHERHIGIDFGRGRDKTSYFNAPEDTGISFDERDELGKLRINYQEEVREHKKTRAQNAGMQDTIVRMTRNAEDYQNLIINRRNVIVTLMKFIAARKIKLSPAMKKLAEDNI